MIRAANIGSYLIAHNSIDCRWADAEAKGIAPRTISVQLRSNFEHTSPFTPASGLVRFLHLCIDDHGSLVIFRSASVRPKHLIDPYFDQDYLFELPLQGAGCSITSAVFYSPPCRFSSCPAYEPNSNEGEYSHPFRHIQYKRIAILRPIATLAMLLCRRIARCRSDAASGG